MPEEVICSALPSFSWNLKTSQDPFVGISLSIAYAQKGMSRSLSRFGQGHPVKFNRPVSSINRDERGSDSRLEFDHHSATKLPASHSCRLIGTERAVAICGTYSARRSRLGYKGVAPQTAPKRNGSKTVNFEFRRKNQLHFLLARNRTDQHTYVAQRNLSEERRVYAHHLDDHVGALQGWEENKAVRNRSTNTRPRISVQVLALLYQSRMQARRRHSGKDAHNESIHEARVHTH